MNHKISFLTKEVAFRSLTICSCLFLALLGSSCQKDSEPVPRANFTLYTQISSKFDRLDVYIDNKLVGALTTTSRSIPTCGASVTPSILTTPVTAGSHAIEVKQIYQNKEVGIWDDWTETFEDGGCIRRKLTE